MGYALRPIVTLKAGLDYTGSGTSASPWVIQPTVYTANVGTDVTLGDAIPNGVTQYSSPTEAMAALKAAGGGTTNYPFFLKHHISNSVVSESYAGFVVTPTMATANPGMRAGTYYLKGEDGGTTSTFLANAKIIYDAFGGSNCAGDNNLPATYDASYNPNPSSNFSCYVTTGLSLIAYANADGRVFAGVDARSGCRVIRDVSDCILAASP